MLSSSNSSVRESIDFAGEGGQGVSVVPACSSSGSSDSEELIERSSSGTSVFSGVVFSLSSSSLSTSLSLPAASSLFPKNCSLLLFGTFIPKACKVSDLKVSKIQMLQCLFRDKYKRRTN